MTKDTERLRRFRQARIAAGNCATCGKPREPERVKRTQCVSCAKQASAATQRWLAMKQDPDGSRAYKRAWLARRRALGVCVQCGAPIEDGREGRWCCRPCSDKANESTKRYRKRRREQEATS